MGSQLKQRIEDATKDAMRARERQQLGALRLINAALKQVEVDERKVLGDTDVLSVLNRMLKQRRDSFEQYDAAGREDLAAQERFEIDLIESFMPAQMSEADIAIAVKEAVEVTAAETMGDMGKVMAHLKDELTGKADMGLVSRQVKTQLNRA
ncbi:MAG: GatB/YqeY domain-containing protein [Pseudomonadota bacterium]|nr:GatB/YqeY domain-containing protein [Pseudomonadota bacterium]MEC9285521.1 GatB/YqeY domain-containing protein [Pseudomonadota bacterium]